MNALKFWRILINLVDLLILICLRVRFWLVGRVVNYKLRTGIPIYQPKREAAMINRINWWAKLMHLPPQLAVAIFSFIVTEFRQQEQKLIKKKR